MKTKTKMKMPLTYRIDEDACINCGSCRRFCPVDTIPYVNLRHQIDMAGCIGCTVCYAVCPVDAVIVTEGGPHGPLAALDPADMERVRVRTWAKGPFYQFKRRLAGVAPRRRERRAEQPAPSAPRP